MADQQRTPRATPRQTGSTAPGGKGLSGRGKQNNRGTQGATRGRTYEDGLRAGFARGVAEMNTLGRAGGTGSHHR